MDKQKQIIEMFDQIAPTYDSANRILSLGIDVAWRREACKKAFEYFGENKPSVILDVACGTGDMILHWEKNAKKFQKDFGKIIGIDPSSGMLEVAQEKLKNQLKSRKAELLLGEAKNLRGIENQSVDILSIAYGLRNVVDVKEALSEFARVLKKGGVLVVLEFTKKEKENFLDKIAGFYTRNILPLIGGLVSKNYKAYKYLPDSIDGFLTSSMLTQELSKLGIHTRFIKAYSANISTLLIGVKQ
ncbi:bifunctional demethylmenaquinone methyltransferase/2-methoxy-6-polyprenyl-1,4-benzoquinol methylase UbiE [Helicobacter cappadocius]|uniref:Demethylmenaquinone methyltransferase n=1 Tax=Helicobacter cappadocius TaxID=3063998 RepID=A0AA90PU51_9HELI|nr:MULTISPECIES: bifunctional demethylmenaquinone methyltransferase/2-methoxy-6-polyprenyl-1,4-benzoquinol methylase UbiE [unclassified Helicobacter]MDO7253094.1 bifunctional demethylmenaquinone methyltransferase/2-methoxy-6-polyprenyl-1,4-benzoquinol methylase UbiE [Helicobacter sp. faydin-H75]MDP2538780.1 bifunctional demethylmenaquinone methyltransferase/2-methoxy-6-polyprenyl-1,4-benzoquinol methylase UbiE [Helicobacter sp. faydin-H76]